jgi:hypothetical protein
LGEGAKRREGELGMSTQTGHLVAEPFGT